MSASELCPQCGGDGRIFEDGDAEPRACVCKLREKFRASVGAEIFDAERLGGEPRLDACRDLTFRSEWTAALPHIRQAMLRAWLGAVDHSHVVTTDLMIVDEALSSGADGLEALLGAQHRLVIVRLGFLPSKNAGAAGALLSGLRHRVEVWRAPVWITDTPEFPFVRGHFAWSETIKKFIAQNFTEVKL